jgi:hypothetical protein
MWQVRHLVRRMSMPGPSGNTSWARAGAVNTRNIAAAIGTIEGFNRELFTAIDLGLAAFVSPANLQSAAVTWT